MIFSTFVFNTFKEAFAKKIILIVLIFIALLNMLILTFINLDSVEGINEMLLLSGMETYRDAVIKYETTLLNQFSFLVVFCILMVMSASFMPTMLEKGNIDIILSKPISRVKIIIGKFLSVVLLAFVIIALLILIIWLIISLKTGIWYFPYLNSILWLTFIFAVLYSLELLIGLISQSTILSLLVTLVVLFPVTALLAVRENLVFNYTKNETIIFLFNIFYHIFPKPWDMREMCVQLIEGLPVESWWPAITSGLFMLTMISLAVLYFSKKDY